MSRRNLITIVVSFSLVMFFACTQKNTVEIVALHLPDSVIFKPASEIQIEFASLEVSLVSKSNDLIKGKLTAFGEIILMGNKEGHLVQLLTDKTKIRVSNFNLPYNFEPQKIKFVVNSKEMYYNIANAKWE